MERAARTTTGPRRTRRVRTRVRRRRAGDGPSMVRWAHRPPHRRRRLRACVRRYRVVLRPPAAP